MVVTVEQALVLLPIASRLLDKLRTVAETGTEMSIEEEIKALEAARMRPSDEVIADADAVSKG